MIIFVDFYLDMVSSV